MERNIPKKEDFLRGKLSEAERSAFLQTLKNDPVLEAEVRADAVELAAAKKVMEQKYLQKIKKMRAERHAGAAITPTAVDSPPTTAKVRQLRPLRRILSIAAAVLVLVVAGGIGYGNLQYSDATLIENSVFTPDTAGTLSGNNNTDQNISQGLQALLLEKDFTKASTIFAAVPTTDSQYGAARYYLGHAYLKSEKFAEAVEVFNQLLNTPTNLPNYINREKLEWNALLARLGQGEEVTAALANFTNSNNARIARQAKELQAKLASPWRVFAF